VPNAASHREKVDNDDEEIREVNALAAKSRSVIRIGSAGFTAGSRVRQGVGDKIVKL